MVYLRTQSIIGHDPRTDKFGVAVASAVVSVGRSFRYAAPSYLGRVVPQSAVTTIDIG